MDKNIPFIRRYSIIKELIEESFDVLRGEVCDYAFGEFLTEVCWQVSDKRELLRLSEGSIEIVHMWVRSNFYTYIRKMFEKLLQEESCFDDFYDDNDEYDNDDYIYDLDNN
jgi:hypothetical protein